MGIEPNLYKIELLKALSIAKIKILNRWYCNNIVVELPYVWKGGIKVFSSIDRFEVINNDSMSTYLRVDANSEGLIYLDNKPYHSYREGFKEIPLIRQFNELKLEFFGRSLNGLGAINRVNIFNSACIIYRYNKLYKFAKTLEVLYDLWLKNSGSDFGKDLKSLIDGILSQVPIDGIEVFHLQYVKEYIESRELSYPITLGKIMEIPYTVLKEAGCRGVDYHRLEKLIDHSMKTLRDELSRLVSKYGKKGVLYAIATTHLDYLWLWNYELFKKKLLGTISTLLLYKEKFPYIAIGITSTHYIYELSRQDPTLFNSLKKCFENGSCIAVGGFWTEFDANLIDGESIIRQYYYGQKYLQKLIGIKARISFLPDTFGFPPSIPQIALKSGIELFVVRKLSWNEYNRFPYRLFLWRGIDGSQIPTIFVDQRAASIPVSIFDLDSITRDVEKMLYPYGYGDGGGGPSEDFIHTLDVLSKCPKTPSIVYGNVFELLNEFKNKKRIAVWFGELYLETHRGVYTVAQKLKQLLHLCVKRIKRVEALLAVTQSLGTVDSKYFKEKLEQLWLEILSNQFHDILASTISFDALIDVLKSIAKILKELDMMEEYLIDSLKDICKSGLLIFNPHAWEYTSIIEVKIPKNVKSLKYGDKLYPLQILSCDEIECIALAELELPSLGFRIYELSNKELNIPSSIEAYCAVDKCVLENEYLRIVIDREDGGITSIYDKELQRELLNSKAEIKVYEDIPRHWDAWNIDEDYKDLELEKPSIEYIDIDFKGPLRSCLVIRRKFRNSRITQRICLDKSSRIVWITNEFDWHERYTLVKMVFDFDINTHEAWYETSLGAFPRTVHRNTSWDQAKFEVWTHRWIDISEPDFGVTIILLGPHGIDPFFNKFSITLLKSPVSPAPLDIGFVKNTIGIYVHRDDWRKNRVQHLVREVDETPLVITIDGKGTLNEISIIKMDREAVVEGVKVCEDRDRCLVLRVFEGYGMRSRCTISSQYSKLTCIETDVLEESKHRVNCDNILLRPFEFKNIVVEFEQNP